MSFSPRPGNDPSRHLDLTGDREVVYCHICRHEWYNDEHPGLSCPRCHNDFCEIISPENDPRDITPDPPSPSGVPDPDEDDIGAAFPPHGFFMPPDRSRQNRDRDRDRGAGSPIDPSSEQEIFTRFQETLNMLMGLGGGPLGPAGRSNRETLFGGGPGGHTETRTFRTPGGRTTFTFTTSNMAPGARGMGPDHNHDQNFDMIFGNVMGGGGIRPPDAGHPGLENNVQGLFSLLFGPGLAGPNAVHGDAVYSQEALDRIITQLMEANPQSNAAPPATEQAIENLQKKRLDKEMMGESGKAECTICIDDMHIGDEVTVLPCKHWFHEECVVLWLKEHNTCPICRTPIEKREGNGGSGNAGASGDNHRSRVSGGAGSSSGGSRFGGWFGGGGGGGNPWGGGASDSTSATPGGPYQNRGARSPEERERRLNSIRNLAGPSSYGQASQDSPRYRRDSWSPTSPPPGASSARERSPNRPRPDRTNSSSWSSQRSGRSSHNSGGNGGGSSNPINWIRDRFGGGGGGGGSSSSGSTRRRS